MTEVAEAVERVLEAAEAEAGIGKMTQAEAVDFYQQLAEACVAWAETITSEMNGGTEG